MYINTHTYRQATHGDRKDLAWQSKSIGRLMTSLLGNEKINKRKMRYRGFRLTQLYFNSHVNFRCIYFHLKMVVRPKHIADSLNKIVNNYWNRVALDGNPCTWYNTRNRMLTPKFKNRIIIVRVVSCAVRVILEESLCFCSCIPMSFVGKTYLKGFRYSEELLEVSFSTQSVLFQRKAYCFSRFVKRSCQ
jgi:hypothetical protein